MRPRPFLAPRIEAALANLKLNLLRLAQDEDLRNQERALFGDRCGS